MRKLLFILMVSLTACDYLPLANKPHAERQHAEIAAKDCDIDEWRWERAVYFDALPDQFESFSYDLRPLPEERVEFGEGIAWDMTKRVQITDACLNASFDRQGVEAKVHSAGHRMGATDPNTTADEMTN